MAACALLLLLAGPGAETYRLAYRFERGMVLEDTQARTMEMTTRTGERRFRWELRFESTLRRTILEVDASAHPRSERVEVVRFRRHVVESPEEKAGETIFPCEGRTFLWKRLETRWGLFEGDREVTTGHKELVTQLKNWRDARLPSAAVERGGSWEVSAKTFLETAGMAAPPEVSGLARFTLAGVGEGVATIPFELRFGYRAGTHTSTGIQRGTWRFDIARGRDLSFEMEGTVSTDAGRTGTGTVSMRRTVTYPDGSRGLPGDPRDSPGSSDRGS